MVGGEAWGNEKATVHEGRKVKSLLASGISWQRSVNSKKATGMGRGDCDFKGRGRSGGVP